MIDVDILDNMTVEYAKSILIKVVKQQVATMIVNGEVQDTQEVECVEIVCPECNNTIQQFNSGISIAEVYRAFGEAKEENKKSYCPHCRTRLSFDKRFVSIQQGVFVK